MKQIERINYLLEKYLDKSLDSEEAAELFDRLKVIRDPELLDKIFHGGWTRSGDQNLGHLLSWEQLKEDLDRRNVQKVSFNRSRSLSIAKWSIAATILALVAFVWWFSPNEPEFQAYQTGFGETQTIILDDGTQVILNANSELVWHLDLEQDEKGREYRLAELTGEAYFDVSHLNRDGHIVPDMSDVTAQEIPFKVRTSDLTVNVLGTAFNVSNRRGKTDVYLDNGSVQLELLDGQTTNTGMEEEFSPGTKLYETLMMQPGDMVSFSAATGDLHKTEAENPDRFTEWKDGTLVFENVDFGAVLDRLEDIYGKKFYVLDTLLLQTPISAGLPYKDWEVVTQLLEVTFNVNLKEDQNNIVRLEKRKG